MKINSWGPAPAPLADSASMSGAAVSSQDATGSDDFGATLASLDGRATEQAQDEAADGSSAKTAKRDADDATADTGGKAVRDQPAGAAQEARPGDASQPYAPTIIRMLSRAATPATPPLASSKSNIAATPSPPPTNLIALSEISKAKTPAASTAGSPDASARKSDAADPSSAAPSAAATGTPATVPADLLTLLTSAAVPFSAVPSTRSNAPSSTRRDTAALAATPKAAGSTQTGDIAGSESPALAISHIAIESQIAPAASLTVGTGASAGVDPKSAAAAKVDATLADAPSTADVAKAIDTVDATTPAGSTTGAPLATLAPSALPIMNAVSTAVLDLAKASASPSNAADIPDAPTGLTPAPARTMTLQLNPENLGSVTVRLHVTGSSLDVDLTVSDPQTLGLISREHDTLASALRDQSYDLNSLVVQSPGAAATHLGDQNAQSQGGGGSGQPSAERQSNGGNGASGQGQKASSDREQRDSRPSPDAPAERNAGLLFV